MQGQQSAYGEQELLAARAGTPRARPELDELAERRRGAELAQPPLEGKFSRSGRLGEQRREIGDQARSQRTTA